MTEDKDTGIHQVTNVKDGIVLDDIPRCWFCKRNDNVRASRETSYSPIVCQDPRYQDWLLHYYNASQNYDIVAKTIKVIPRMGGNLSGVNTRLNDLVDFCLKSLPNGIQACDKQLKDVVTQVCAANNGVLDACHNGKVNQYYVARAAELSRPANKTR